MWYSSYLLKLPLSSRGLGRGPFKAKTGVRIPVGALFVAYLIPGTGTYNTAFPFCLSPLFGLQKSAMFAALLRHPGPEQCCPAFRYLFAAHHRCPAARQQLVSCVLP